jgi:hypothetical protein
MSAESSNVAQATVPNLVGLAMREALTAGSESGVVVTSENIDGRPLRLRTMRGRWIVTAQRPASGSRVPQWSGDLLDRVGLQGGITSLGG